MRKKMEWIEEAYSSAGELIGRIIDEDPLRKFAGYTDAKATSKKVESHTNNIIYLFVLEGHLQRVWEGRLLLQNW